MIIDIYKIDGDNKIYICSNSNIVVANGLDLICKALAGMITAPVLNYAELAHYDGSLSENAGISKVCGRVQAASTVISWTIDGPHVDENNRLKAFINLIVEITFDLSSTSVEFNEVGLYHKISNAEKILFAYSAFDSVQNLSAAKYIFQWTFSFYT